MEREELIKQQMEAARPDFDSPDKYTLFKDLHLEGVEIESDRLDFTIPYTPPRFLVSINDTKVLSLGNIHGITGQYGSGKTMFISMLIAATLGGEYENIRVELSDEERENIKILYVDTEQGIDDTIALKNRALRMAGWPIDENTDAFSIYRLRDTDEATERLKKTFRAIIDLNPTLAIVDGVLDLVGDFNDQVQCSKVIYQFMKLASSNDVCIVFVLHQNPQSNYSSADKMAGHLGSTAQRKANDIFCISKEKDVIPFSYKVSNTKSRGHAPLEDWHFTVNNDAEGHGIPVPVKLPTASNRNATSENLPKPEDVSKWLYDYQDRIQWPAMKRDCERLFKLAGVNDEQLRDCVTVALNRTFLTKEPKRANERSQRLSLNRIHIMAKPRTEAQTNDSPNLPFPPTNDEQTPF